MKKIVVALGLVFSSQVFANAGDAGCGLGSLVWSGKNGKLSQVLAATTNGTFGSQTFGITTGTSNCKASGLVMTDKERIYYANSNLNNIIEDMAKGSGEHLNAMASLYGCDSASYAEFSVSAQKQFQNLNDQVSGQNLVETFHSVISTNPSLKNSCKATI